MPFYLLDKKRLCIHRPIAGKLFFWGITAHGEGKIANENSKIGLSKNIKLQHKKRKITPNLVILYANYLSSLIMQQ